MVNIKAIYIKEADKPNKIFELFNIVKINDNQIILPIKTKKLNEIEAKQDIKSFFKTQKKEKKKRKKLAKIIKKVNKYSSICGTKNIVISKELQKSEILLDIINCYGFNIINGRWLCEYLAYEIINYIVKNTKIKKEETEIAVLVNNNVDTAIKNIYILAKEFKRVNIVTNHINKFKRVEENLYDKYGIMITITNNKRKSLLKSEIILNFDFVQEVLNEYNIYENAIIINIEGDIKILKKRFNGINVNNYEIKSIISNDLFSVEKLKYFYLKDLAEAEIYRKDSFENIKKDIKKGKYEIKNLYGNNGIVLNN